MISTKQYSTTRKMPVGVHTDVTVSKAELETTKSGRQLIKVHFLNKAGQAIDRGIWVPDLSNVKAFEGESTQQAKDREIRNFVQEITNISTSVFPFESAHMEAETVESLAKMFITRVNNNEKYPVNIAVQYDSDYTYPELPKKRYGWIEKYDGNPHNLMVDLFRMTKENTSSTGISSFGNSTSTNDDLPF